MHKRIQDTIFTGSNVCDFLKGLIKERFGVSDIPDAFISEILGGLGVRNPFLSPFLLRDNVCESPSELVDRFLQKEAEAYRQQTRTRRAYLSWQKKTIETNHYRWLRRGNIV